MAEATPNLGLHKPLESEFVSINTLNENMDKVDQSLGAVNDLPTSATNVAGAISEVYDHLTDKPPNQLTLTQGVQVIQGGDVPAILHPTMRGRTLVNLLGRDGNCEDVSKWTTFQSSFVLEPYDKMIGLNSIKVTGTGGGVSHSDINKTVSLQAGKYYFAGCYTKNVNAPTNIRFYLGSAFVDVGKHASWTFAYVKLAPESNVSTTLTARNVNGGNTSFLVDGARIFEISQTEYDALDTMTADQIAAAYPYVDDMKHVNAVYIENKGKNLLPPFSEWMLHENAVVMDSYKLALNSTANSQPTYADITAIPGQAYTVSATHNGRLNLLFVDSGNNVALSAGYQDSQTITLTAPSNARRIRALFSNDTLGAGSFYCENPMLNIGSEPLPFEPQRPSDLYLPDCSLRSNVDGSVADRLYTDGQGKPRVTRRFREIALDGSLDWKWNIDGTGHKSAYAPIAGKTIDRTNGRLVKYDGKIIPSEVDAISSERNWFSSLFESIYVSIPDTDSGWGESYTPTVDEIKAYFYGWRMRNTDSTAPYNGTGTKGWSTIASNGLSAVQTVLPTTVAPDFTTPYRLLYQLVQSVDEPVTYEGSLMLHEGANQVEVGTGIVVREAANPAVDGGKTFVAIGNKVSTSYATSSQLKYRPLSVLEVFRNNSVDIWRRSNLGTSLDGKEIAYTDYALFDPTAAYSVTYLALDTYAIGIAPKTVNAEYAPNIRESVESLVRELVEARTETSVLANTKAQKQQPQWILATLRNDWVNFDPAWSQVGYMRDDFGFVHLRGLIKSGVTAVGTLIFILPPGYRPKLKGKFPIHSYTGSGAPTSFGTINIRETGNVEIEYTAGSSWLSLDGITFPVE